jgi:hypothetical protein
MLPAMTAIGRREVLAGMGAVCAAPAFASSAALEAAGWKHLTFRKLPATRFTPGVDGAIDIVADRSSSILYRWVRVDPAATPRLSWRWRVDAGVPATDLARKGGDDRSLALLVGFAFDRANASAGERTRHRFETMVAGTEPPGVVIFYVWGGSAAGRTIRSPYRRNSHLVILRGADAPMGRWFDESVDVAADYRRLTGYPAPPVVQLGLCGDSDDTGVVARGGVAGLRWSR